MLEQVLIVVASENESANDIDFNDCDSGTILDDINEFVWKFIYLFFPKSNSHPPLIESEMD